MSGSPDRPARTDTPSGFDFLSRVKAAVLIFFVAALTLAASLVVLGALAAAISGGGGFGFGFAVRGVSEKLLILLAGLMAFFLILLAALRRRKRSM